MQSDNFISNEPTPVDATNKSIQTPALNDPQSRPKSELSSSCKLTTSTSRTQGDDNSNSDPTSAKSLKHKDGTAATAISTSLPRNFSPGFTQEPSLLENKPPQLPVTLNIPISMEDLGRIGNIPTRRNRPGSEVSDTTVPTRSNLESFRGILPSQYFGLASENQRLVSLSKTASTKTLEMLLEIQPQENSATIVVAAAIATESPDEEKEEKEEEEEEKGEQAEKEPTKLAFEEGTTEKDRERPNSKNNSITSKSKLETTAIKSEPHMNPPLISQNSDALKRLQSFFLRPQDISMSNSASTGSEIESNKLPAQNSSSLAGSTSHSQLDSSGTGSYYTAQTSQTQATNSTSETPLLQSIQSSPVKTSTSANSPLNYKSLSYTQNVAKDEDNDSVLENTEYDNLDSPDKGYNELDHKPPFIPSQQSFGGFGKPSLRQTVIRRQSARVAPASDPLLEHMEQRLARWNGPQSASSAADAINGRHPYQRPDIPILEPTNPTTTNHSSPIRESPINEESETNTSIESILRSAYVSNQLVLDCPQRQVAFREEVQTLDRNDHASVQFLSPESNTSIQDGTRFYCRAEVDESDVNPPPLPAQQQQQQQIPDSASVSSSMLQRINDMSQHSPQTKPRDYLNLDISSILAERTPEAFPLNSGDLRDLTKGITVEHGLRDNPFVLQRVEPDPISGFAAYDQRLDVEENGFWSSLTDCCILTFTCGCLDPDLDDL